MKNHIRFGIRALCLAILTILCVVAVNHLLIPKYYYDNNWPTTTGLTGFYDMEEDSVDILFMGSSHTMTQINPQVLYDLYGMRSYNLASEQQNLVLTYWWLKEALRYQSPECVVLDTYFLFTYKHTEVLNSAEASTRKALDSMRWSQVKWEAVRDICAIDEAQSLMSYIFPNIRYHSRWMDLVEDDFPFTSLAGHCELKGYDPLYKAAGSETYAPFAAGDSTETEEMLPLMEEYLDKIVALCKEEGIELILIKTPSTSATVKKYNTLCAYAEANDLTYLDFNEQSLYESSGFVFTEDMYDGGHGNVEGALKITTAMGNILAEDFGIEGDKTDAQWEETAEYYAQVYRDFQLVQIEDFATYISLLKDDSRTIFITFRNNAEKCLNTEMRALMEEALGIHVMTLFDDESYFAVLEDGEVFEMHGESLISHYGSFRDGHADYEIISAGYAVGNTSAVKINAAEVSKNYNGINIVVYDKKTNRVIDSVNFDTKSYEWPTAVR